MLLAGEDTGAGVKMLMSSVTLPPADGPASSSIKSFQARCPRLTLINSSEDECGKEAEGRR